MAFEGAVPRFFIDANVLLNVAEPGNPWMQTQSRRLLEAHRHELCTSDLVQMEVVRKLRDHPHAFRGKKEVLRWLAACSVFLLLDQKELIEQLGREYAANGWYGQPGDADDRLHAATATAHGVPYLVTWDNRFRAQQEWVREVNARHGQKVLTLISPTTP